MDAETTASRPLRSSIADIETQTSRRVRYDDPDLSQAVETHPPGEENRRFLETRLRTIERYPIKPLCKTILVTGGTGCIGRNLLSQIRSVSEAQLVSIARRPPSDGRRISGVTYLCADVRDFEAIHAIVRDVQPELLVHLAAQRDPGLAERTVLETISTNVGGTVSVMKAAGEMGVPVVSTASTGKVVRYFTSDVYAGSKAVAEYVVARAAEQFGLAATCSRFTHVVDNSILFSRLHSWSRAGQPIRLHGAHVHFYVQSALECAQLLMMGSLGPFEKGAGFVALRDLGWPPISLAALARDVVASYGDRSPIEIVGFEPGYEEEVHPATYDPRSAGSVSPLINALEASRTTGVAPCSHAVDGVSLFGSSPPVDEALADLLDAVAFSEHETTLRSALNRVSAEIFSLKLRRSELRDTDRLAARASAMRVVAPDHVVVNDILARWRADGLSSERETPVDGIFVPLDLNEPVGSR